MMKTFRIFSFLLGILTLGTSVNAQEKSEQIAVSGNCGMCEGRIEKAAKAGGATTASWDEDTKILSVTYDPASTTTLKIQQKIAAVGHDTKGVKTPTAVYDKLPGCCKYKRETAKPTGSIVKAKSSSCSDLNCCKESTCTDSKCCDEVACSKENHMKTAKL